MLGGLMGGGGVEEVLEIIEALEPRWFPFQLRKTSKTVAFIHV